MREAKSVVTSTHFAYARRYEGREREGGVERDREKREGGKERGLMAPFFLEWRPACTCGNFVWKISLNHVQ